MKPLHNLLGLANSLNTDWLGRVIGVVAICGIGILATACNATEPSDLHFDPQKSSSLDQETRRKYEVDLFNQILVRGEPSEMLSDGSPSTQGRYYRIKKMADDGFEPAYLAMRIYDFRHGDLRRNDPEAMSRLVELAESGDATAKCLYANYYWLLNPDNSLKAKLDNYVQEAAGSGVPACMSLMPELKKIVSAEALGLEIKAARRGDLRAQKSLFMGYYHGWMGEKDIDLAECWLREAEKSGTNYARRTRRIFFSTIKDAQPSAEFCAKAVNIDD